MDNTFAFIVLPILFITMGIITFIAYGRDKHKAIKGKWRTPEKTLFIMNYMGGFLGGWSGMFFFRHKTKHKSFYIVQFTASLIWLFVWGWCLGRALK